MQNKLDLAIKNKQLQAAKLFKVAKLQNVMVFGLEDELIASIELTPGRVTSQRSIYSIDFNASCKQKRDKTGRPLNNAVLLLETFERSTVVLVDALTKTQEP